MAGTALPVDTFDVAALPSALAARIKAYDPCCWINTSAWRQASSTALSELRLSEAHFNDAADTWQQLRPLIKGLFGVPDGLIDSPLIQLSPSFVSGRNISCHGGQSSAAAARNNDSAAADVDDTATADAGGAVSLDSVLDGKGDLPSPIARGPSAAAAAAPLNSGSQGSLDGYMAAIGQIHQLADRMERERLERERKRQEAQVSRLPDISSTLCSDGATQLDAQVAGLTPRPRHFIKSDNELPVCGSIKARGGMFEVLSHAYKLALAQGWLRQREDVALLASEDLRRRFSNYTVLVGSTGNLGLSVGTCASALGMCSVVHMSQEAKLWKRQLLGSKVRSKGRQGSLCFWAIICYIDTCIF